MALAGPARGQRSSALLDPLPSAAPAAADTAHDLYGWLIGVWEMDVTDHLPDGTRRQGTGEWHFGRVLQGRAIQDVWISPRRGERLRAGGAPDPWDRYGTSIRFFDPAIDAWRVTWVNPVQNYVATLVGRASGSEIVHHGTGNEGMPLRWTFFGINEASFRWRGEMSADGGRTWRLVQEMTGRRALPRGPEPPGPSARLLDALLADGPLAGDAGGLGLFGQFVGSWEGTVSGRNPDGSWTTGIGELHFDWVLEGRAIQDVWIFPKRGTGRGPTPADEYGSTIRFRDPSSGAWAIVWISPVNHAVLVYRGRAEGDEIIVEGTDTRGRPQRWIFSQVTPTSFHWRNLVSDDGGKTWRAIERVDARRVAAAPPAG